MNHPLLRIAALPALLACAPSTAPPATDGAAIPARPVDDAHQHTAGFPALGVRISSDMPGGRLNEVRLDGDSLLIATIRPENTPINNSAWYAFKAWADAPRTIRLRLTYENGRHRYWPETRRQGGRWVALDSAAVTTDSAANTATLTLQLGPDTLWVAAQELITSREIARWADSLAALPHVHREQIGDSPLGRPIEMLTIGDAAATRHVLIIGRQHPPEVTGTVALRRFVEELAGETELARAFRRGFQVRIVPLVNPDGVDLGHWRHNTAGVDLNRDWVDFRQAETRLVRDALLRVRAQPGTEVWFAADFHSTNRDVLYTLDRTLGTVPPGLIDRWIGRIREELPAYTLAESRSGLQSPIARNWFYREFRAPALTYEFGDGTDRDLIRRVATTAARALMELLLEEAGGR